MSDQGRRDALVDLIGLRTSTEAAVERLRIFPRDSDVELATLRRVDALSALYRYLNGSLDDAAVEEWANAIEGRDDIGFEPGHESLLRDFVFDMANPLLADGFDRPVAERWVSRLTGSPPEDVTTIFVALLDEGVEVWRPVRARHLRDWTYVIADQAYERDVETWQFEPGTVVVCEMIDASSGQILAATRAAPI